MVLRPEGSSTLGNRSQWVRVGCSGTCSDGTADSAEYLQRSSCWTAKQKARWSQAAQRTLKALLRALENMHVVDGDTLLTYLLSL